MQRRNYFTKASDETVVTLGKRIVNICTGQKLGLLILNVKESSLSAIYQKIGSTQNGRYFISVEEGNEVPVYYCDVELRVGQKEDMEEGKLVIAVITAWPDTPQLAAIVTVCQSSLHLVLHTFLYGLGDKTQSVTLHGPHLQLLVFIFSFSCMSIHRSEEVL